MSKNQCSTEVARWHSPACFFSLESDEIYPSRVFNGLSSAIIGGRPMIIRLMFSNGIFLLKVSASKTTLEKNAYLLFMRIALSYPEGNFVRVKGETVNYETRKWRILEQILIHQPDLCSLEEMDIYDCFLKEHLPRYGYAHQRIAETCHRHDSLALDTPVSSLQNRTPDAFPSKVYQMISKVRTAHFFVTKTVFSENRTETTPIYPVVVVRDDR